jgi:peptidyl-prolyl cis-trans isomerase A (cyclophilin A)
MLAVQLRAARLGGMTKRIIAALLLLLPAVATAQDAAPPPAAPQAPVAPPHRYQTVRITMTTSLGPIVLELEAERAPLTTANFLRYVDQRRLDGTSFYRAMDLGRGYGLVQGGPRNEARRVLPPVAHEPTTQTGLSHTDGAISLARAAPGSATADFFITVGDLVSLDAQPSQAGDNAGFAVFGHVVEGMDVVRQIMAAPTDANAGEGVMRGQMIAAPVRIVSVRRTPAAPTPSPATPAGG